MVRTHVEFVCNFLYPVQRAMKTHPHNRYTCHQSFHLAFPAISIIGKVSTTCQFNLTTNANLTIMTPCSRFQSLFCGVGLRRGGVNIKAQGRARTRFKSGYLVASNAFNVKDHCRCIVFVVLEPASLLQIKRSLSEFFWPGEHKLLSPPLLVVG